VSPIHQEGQKTGELALAIDVCNREHRALALRRAPLPDAQGLSDTHLRRAGIEASVWACFLGGAIISGVASTAFGVWALVAPCFVLLALALTR
jgi:uncharacterized membrane protein YoaK (UPF0700 family)